MTSAPQQPLRGRAVLVTRPIHQTDKLVGLINAAGGEAILFPALAIESPENPAPVRQLLAELARFDLAIFVSSNAVEYGLALLARSWPVSPSAAPTPSATRSRRRAHP